MKIWTTDLGPDGMLDTWVEKYAYDELKAENERLILQLAACGVIAMANTKESAERCRIPKDNHLWCASINDITNAVDREMSLAKQRDSALALIAVMKTALEGMVRFGTELCEDVKVSTHQYSIERAREALAAERSFREGGE
jgi:hypothetical protein